MLHNGECIVLYENIVDEKRTQSDMKFTLWRYCSLCFFFGCVLRRDDKSQRRRKRRTIQMSKHLVSHFKNIHRSHSLKIPESSPCHAAAALERSRTKRNIFAFFFEQSFHVIISDNFSFIFNNELFFFRGVQYSNGLVVGLSTISILLIELSSRARLPRNELYGSSGEDESGWMDSSDPIHRRKVISN